MRTHSQVWRHCESARRDSVCKSVGWLVTAALAGILTGCGVGASSSAPDATGAAADPAAAGAAVPVASPAAGGQAIMVTPAGGGVVVGDPFDAGRGAASAPVAVAPGAAPAAAVPVAVPAGPGRGPNDPAFAAGAPPTFGVGATEDRVNAPVRGGLEPGDEPPPNPAAAAIPPGRVGAFAEDKGAFANDRRRQKKGDDDDTEANQPAPAGANVLFPANGGEFGRVPDVDGVGRVPDGDGGFAPTAGEGGQPATIEVKRGSAEEVTASFLALVAAGDMEQAATLIAGRATGLLAKIRDGKATPEEIAELKQAVDERGQMTSRPKGGTHMQFSVRGEKTVLLIEADQKEVNSSVVKLEMRDVPRKRR